MEFWLHGSANRGSPVQHQFSESKLTWATGSWSLCPLHGPATLQSHKLSIKSVGHSILSPISADLSRRDPRAVHPTKWFSVDPIWTSSLFSAGYGYKFWWPAETQTKKSLNTLIAEGHSYAFAPLYSVHVFVHISVCVTHTHKCIHMYRETHTQIHIYLHGQM